MGRHCGWLTAATARAYLQRTKGNEYVDGLMMNAHMKSIDAVYLPEMAFDLDAEAVRLKEIMPNEKSNSRVFDRYLSSNLDDTTRAYWNTRKFGRRRVTVFDRNIYETGLLGRFIGAAHLLARLHESRCAVCNKVLNFESAIFRLNFRNLPDRL